MRALVAANSVMPPRGVLEPWLRRARLVVAADGGADRLLSMGIAPAYVVGDLDSVRGSTRRRLGTSRVIEDLDPDHTDLQKAIRVARDEGATDVTIVGASQGRLDHVLGCVTILLETSKEIAVRLVDGDFVTEVVRGRLRFEAPVGTLVSLFAPRRAVGVTTRGLRWRLQHATLRPGVLGIHNQTVARRAEVQVKGGELLVMRSHRVAPHI